MGNLVASLVILLSLMLTPIFNNAGVCVCVCVLYLRRLSWMKVLYVFDFGSAHVAP